MSLITRTFIYFALALSLACRLIGQETSTATAAPATTTTTTAAETATDPAEEKSSEGASYEVRNQFTSLLRQHPPELTMMLKLDPSLLTNEAFMSGYPQVAEYVRKHPSILANPRFYLAEFRDPGQSPDIFGQLTEMFAVIAGFSLAVFAFGWLIRTTIEQKRWNRLSKTQAEVHNKILDRFGSSEELLQYIRTPAGTKFLESAPIPLHVEKRPGSSFTRVIWSIQLGVVLAIASLGMLLVSLRFEGESAQALVAMGAIGFCVGAGFIASAVVSVILSRRLGLWQDPADLSASPAANPIDEPGSMR